MECDQIYGEFSLVNDQLLGIDKRNIDSRYHHEFSY